MFLKDHKTNGVQAWLGLHKKELFWPLRDQKRPQEAKAMKLCGSGRHRDSGGGRGADNVPHPAPSIDPRCPCKDAKLRKEVKWAHDDSRK